MDGMQTMIIFIIFIILLCSTAFAAENTYNDVVRFNDAIYANSAANVSGTLRSADGIFYALEVRNASAQQNALEIGEPGFGKLFLYIQQVGDNFYSTIKSSTNIPLIIDGSNRQVNVKSGLHVASGTTAFSSTAEIMHNPLRIIDATSAFAGIHLTRSVTDSTGLKVYVDDDNNNIVFVNDQPSASHFVFDPPLTNLPYTGDATSMIVYADHIYVSATDTTILTQHIGDTMYSLAWDVLLDSASAQTIVEYVSSASNWIINHFESINDSTGTRLIDYIDNRITARLISLPSLVVIGDITASNLNITGDINASVIKADTGLYASGTVVFASGTAIIGYPTYDTQINDLDTRIATNLLMILSMMGDINNPEGSTSKIISASDTTEIGAPYWEYEINGWDEYGSSGYDQRFKQNPRVISDEIGDFTEYANYYAGKTVGSHSKVRYYLSEGEFFTSENIIRISGVLEDANGLDIYNLKLEEEFSGLATPVDMPLRRVAGHSFVR